MMIETTLSPQVFSTLRQTPEMLEKMLEMATEEAMVSGLAPGRPAETEIVGKSTLGRSDTGSSR